MPSGHRRKPGTVPFDRPRPKSVSQHYTIRKEEIPKNQAWYKDNSKMRRIA